eukprot:2423937-Pyramimonas_sp.AAC.2
MSSVVMVQPKAHQLVDLLLQVSDAVTIPVIASSGAGKPEHFSEVRTAHINPPPEASYPEGRCMCVPEQCP